MAGSQPVMAGSTGHLTTKNMDLKAYIQSFSWDPEDLTEEELQEVQKELQEINSGKILLDGILSHKLKIPKTE